MTEWRRWAGIMVLAGLSLEAGAQEPPVAAPPELAEQAREVAAEFAGTLGQTLRAQLEANGPVAAISVCRDVAPAIARDLSLQKGWRVTRVSLKPRNPLLGSADAFEQTVLRAFDAAVAGGVDPATLDRAEIVIEPDGTYFRYLKALPTAAACLACHGPRDALPPGVADSLAVASAGPGAFGRGWRSASGFAARFGAATTREIAGSSSRRSSGDSCRRQGATQLPLLHTSGPVQTFPHEPQFCGSLKRSKPSSTLPSQSLSR